MRDSCTAEKGVARAGDLDAAFIGNRGGVGDGRVGVASGLNRLGVKRRKWFGEPI